MESNTGRPQEHAGGVGRAGRLFAALALLCGCGLGACSKPASSTETGKTAATAEGRIVGAKDERYAITGEVIRADRERKLLIVQHDEIKGYMPAMTMEFIVSPGDLALAKPGQRIRAEMVPSTTGDIRLEKIWPDDQAATATIAAGALQLRQDTHTRGKHAYREVSELVPDFALYNQNGRVVQSAHFRGKQVMVNFIFSRCPIATMCPAATIKMIAAQRLARDAGVTNLELISITLDPAYDTPGVLKDYADMRGIDTTNFSFLTGPQTAIKDLLTQFGVIAELEGDLIKHTLTTLLIDANGKIAHRADGSAWEPKDFVAKMKRG